LLKESEINKKEKKKVQNFIMNTFKSWSQT
jgi:hypothetical protein